jgi:hypothetical protein
MLASSPPTSALARRFSIAALYESMPSSHIQYLLTAMFSRGRWRYGVLLRGS